MKSQPQSELSISTSLHSTRPNSQPHRRTAFLRLFVALSLACTAGRLSPAWGAQSIARQWNERALAAIRADTPHPPAQARNYFSLSVCMYDAWAAYDPVAVGFVYRGKHTATDVAAA